MKDNQQWVEIASPLARLFFFFLLSYHSLGTVIGGFICGLDLY